MLPRSWREEGSHLERKVGQTMGKVECQAQGRRRCPLGSDRRLLSRGSDVHKVIFWKECSSLWAQEELEEKKRPEPLWSGPPLGKGRLTRADGFQGCFEGRGSRPSGRPEGGTVEDTGAPKREGQHSRPAEGLDFGLCC